MIERKIRAEMKSLPLSWWSGRDSNPRHGFRRALTYQESAFSLSATAKYELIVGTEDFKMSFIAREIDRIRLALLAGSARHDELYAAQQALEWALEPGGTRSPYAMIMDILSDSADCLADRRLPQSSDICSRSG